MAVWTLWDLEQHRDQSDHLYLFKKVEGKVIKLNKDWGGNSASNGPNDLKFFMEGTLERYFESKPVCQNIFGLQRGYVTLAGTKIQINAQKVL